VEVFAKLAEVYSKASLQVCAWLDGELRTTVKEVLALKVAAVSLTPLIFFSLFH